MEILASYGYWGLFLTAFIAGSILPFSAEVMLDTPLQRLPNGSTNFDSNTWELAWRIYRVFFGLLHTMGSHREVFRY